MNSKVDKQLIYEIFRACRLCGAGGGYKMPIIQNIIDLEDSEIELREKIKECVNIEINQNDCMPPLICELCVDKVNDFYEFLDMCRRTNKRTRLRLGLPLQTKPREATNTEDCILGVTEPICVKDEDDEPLLQPKRGDETTLKSRKSLKSIKKEKKKIPEVKVKVESEQHSQSSRTLRGNSSKESIDISPPRTSRSKSQVKFDVNNEPRKDTSKENAVKSILKKDTQPQKKSQKQPVKAVSMKVTESKDTSPRSLKRCRGKEEPSSDASTKKVKISTEISPQKTSQTRPRFHCRICNTKFSRSQALASHLRWHSVKLTNAEVSTESAPQKPAQTQPKYFCRICDIGFKKPQSLANHLRTHNVTYTNVNLACNACCEWFPNAEETAAHHRLHTVKKKPYRCLKCVTNFKNLPAYNSHIEKNKCIPWTENPDVKCDLCWKLFPTDNLMKTHKCHPKNRKPEGESRKCKKTFTNAESRNQHICDVKSKDYLKIRRKLLPMQVRMSRCDPLIADSTKEHYDVSAVDRNFGLDPKCVYPYFSSISIPIKREPMDDFEGMVNIKDDIKQEFCHEEEFIHWGSNNSSDHEQSDGPVRSSPDLIANLYKRRREVNSLSNLALKTIFSKNILGKVSKKRRKSQFEKTEGYEEDIEECNFPGFSNLLIDNASYGSDSIINYTSDNKETDTENSDVSKDCRTDESKESNVNSYNIDIKRDVTNNADDVQSTASEKTDTEKSTIKEIVEKSVTQRSDESEYKNQNNDKCDIEQVNNDNSEKETSCEIMDSNTNKVENIQKSDDFCSNHEKIIKNVEDSNVLNDVDSTKTDENIEEVEKYGAYMKNNSNKTVDDLLRDNVKDYAEMDAKIHRISRDGLGVGTDSVTPTTIDKFEDNQNKAIFNSNKFGCNESDCVEKESHNQNTDNLTRVCLSNGETFTGHINSKKVDESFEEIENEDSDSRTRTQNEVSSLDSNIIGCNQNVDSRNELEINNENVQKIDAPSNDINDRSNDDYLEPISDTEIDDDKLMAALEQRIGITETGDKGYEEKIEMEDSKLSFDDKASIDEILKSGVDTTGLDDVSDDEFNFDEQ